MGNAYPQESKSFWQRCLSHFGWIGGEPYNVAFAVSQFPLWRGVLHVMLMTTILNGIFIYGFCFIERLTVTQCGDASG